MDRQLAIIVVALGALSSCALIDGFSGDDSGDGGPSRDAGSGLDGGPPDDGGITMPICATSIFLGSLDSGSLGATLSPCDLVDPPLLDLGKSCGSPGTGESPGLIFEFEVRELTALEVCAAVIGEQMQTFIVADAVCSEDPAGQCAVDSDCMNLVLEPGPATIYWESAATDLCPVMELSITSSMPAR